MEQGGSPLTVAVRIAFITQYPASLERTNCFFLLASRGRDKSRACAGTSGACAVDQQQAPKLG
ncbi:DUF5701 family protein [Thermocrispum sp.]|uniref:DUF5701 family protein n=1 Tax=Thermocrispum sp. TaxID=2060768 RepID=UPI00338DF7D2